MILLDTHVWVRWIEPDPDPLPVDISRMIDCSDQVAISAVSCWEVAYLVKRNRLILPMLLDEWLQAALDDSGVKACLLPQRWPQGQRALRIFTVIRLTDLLLRQRLKQALHCFRLTAFSKITRN